MLCVDTLAITTLVLRSLSQPPSCVEVLVLIETLTRTLNINPQLLAWADAGPSVMDLTLVSVITRLETAVIFIVLRISLQSLLTTLTGLVLVDTDIATQVVCPPLTAVQGGHPGEAGEGQHGQDSQHHRRDLVARLSSEHGTELLQVGVDNVHVY